MTIRADIPVGDQSKIINQSAVRKTDLPELFVLSININPKLNPPMSSTASVYGKKTHGVHEIKKLCLAGVLDDLRQRIAEILI